MRPASQAGDGVRESTQPLPPAAVARCGTGNNTQLVPAKPSSSLAPTHAPSWRLSAKDAKTLSSWGPNLTAVMMATVWRPTFTIALPAASHPAAQCTHRPQVSMLLLVGQQWHKRCSGRQQRCGTGQSCNSTSDCGRSLTEEGRREEGEERDAEVAARQAREVKQLHTRIHAQAHGHMNA